MFEKLQRSFWKKKHDKKSGQEMDAIDYETLYWKKLSAETQNPQGSEGIQTGCEGLCLL